MIRLSSLRPGDQLSRSDVLSSFKKPNPNSVKEEEEFLDFEGSMGRLKSRSIKESTRVQNLVELYRG